MFKVSVFFFLLIVYICNCSGLLRSIQCVYHAFHARKYVQEHELLLDRAAHHGGIGVALPEQSKNGIPHGCGFEFPIYSVIFIIGLISLIYSTITYEQKIV
jgi:hypothetical protein